jgi:hypothetical protein
MRPGRYWGKNNLYKEWYDKYLQKKIFKEDIMLEHLKILNYRLLLIRIHLRLSFSDGDLFLFGLKDEKTASELAIARIDKEISTDN